MKLPSGRVTCFKKRMPSLGSGEGGGGGKVLVKWFLKDKGVAMGRSLLASGSGPLVVVVAEGSSRSGTVKVGGVLSRGSSRHLSAAMAVRVRNVGEIFG